MKYMLLMNATKSDLASFGTLSPDDIARHVGFMHELNASLEASGELLLAEVLTTCVADA